MNSVAALNWPSTLPNSHIFIKTVRATYGNTKSEFHVRPTDIFIRSKSNQKVSLNLINGLTEDSVICNMRTAT